MTTNKERRGRRRGVPDRHAEIFGESSSSWNHQERRVAQVLGGRTTRGSGCGADKGDVEVRGVGGRSGYLLEAKGTKHASLSVKQVWLRKITREALAKGLMPALQMEIRGDRTADTPALWVAVPLAEFHRLLEAAGSSVEENDDCDGG